MQTLTGWSWSRSGSNLVINSLHLSRSLICFGNQGTAMWTEISVSLSDTQRHNAGRGKAALTLFLWKGADVVRHSLQRVEEHVQVGALNFTPHEELQVRTAVLQLLSRTAFDVEKFGFKSLG